MTNTKKVKATKKPQGRLSTQTLYKRKCKQYNKLVELSKQDTAELTRRREKNAQQALTIDKVEKVNSQFSDEIDQLKEDVAAGITAKKKEIKKLELDVKLVQDLADSNLEIAERKQKYFVRTLVILGISIIFNLIHLAT